MQTPRIEIEEALWRRLVQTAKYQGYESPQQYAIDILEKELARAAATVSDQEVAQKMEELGYLDYGRDI